MLSFYERRHDPNLLVLCYEDIVKDMPAAAARVAAFLGLPADALVLQRAAANSSREAMLRHASKFDDAPGRRAFNRLCGQQAEAGVGVTSKVNPASESRLSEAVRRYADVELWAEVARKTGHADYASLRRALAVSM